MFSRISEFQVAPTPISSRFLCPSPPLLFLYYLARPTKTAMLQMLRFATQAKVKAKVTPRQNAMRMSAKFNIRLAFYFRSSI